MPAPGGTWLCRVCQHSNASGIEFCSACGCPLAAREAEIAERLASREPLPLAARAISLKFILVASIAWLAILVIAWLSSEHMSLSAVGIWLFGAYLVRYLLLRWHGRPAQLGAASIDGELSSVWRAATDVAVGAFLLLVVWFLFRGPAPQ